MAIIIKKNQKKQKPKLQKELITALGKKLYEFDEVKSVAIYVEFKDGSGMRFRKGSEED